MDTDIGVRGVCVGVTDYVINTPQTLGTTGRANIWCVIQSQYYIYIFAFLSSRLFPLHSKKRDGVRRDAEFRPTISPAAVICDSEVY